MHPVTNNLEGKPFFPSLLPIKENVEILEAQLKKIEDILQSYEKTLSPLAEKYNHSLKDIDFSTKVSESKSIETRMDQGLHDLHKARTSQSLNLSKAFIDKNLNKYLPEQTLIKNHIAFYKNLVQTLNSKVEENKEILNNLTKKANELASRAKELCDEKCCLLKNLDLPVLKAYSEEKEFADFVHTITPSYMQLIYSSFAIETLTKKIKKLTIRLNSLSSCINLIQRCWKANVSTQKKDNLST